jgi:hypothetical protein
MQYTVATVILLIVLILLTPLLVLWGLNTLSEQAGLGWYIPHNLWTYLAVYALKLAIAGNRKFNE